MTSTFLQAVVLFSSLSSALPRPTWDDASKSTIAWRSCPEVKELIDASNGVPSEVPFDCGSLDVPMDYSDPDGKKLTLDLFRVNATKEPALGTVLWNSGGPGGTAGENLPVAAPELLSSLGGQFHVVSWDPRGSGKTLPFNCNTTQLQPSGVTKRAEAHIANTNSTAYFLNEGWTSAVAYADACYEQMKDTGDLIGTPYTARDMLEITNALGEGGKLRYWGLSYGSILGDYFAAMFPDKIERMTLDGNVNPWDYQSGTYGNYPADADKTFNAFLEECIKHSENCTLASSLNATKPAHIIDAINTQLAPVAAVADQSTTNYFTLAAIKGFVYTKLYWPATWPTMAETLAALLAGEVPEGLVPDPSTNSTAPKYNALSPNGIDGIRCSDALWSGTTDPLEILDVVEWQATNSENFGDTGYHQTWACAAWKMPAKERYKGTFSDIKTSFPILYVNGNFDPATPAVSAKNASAGFDGSKVLLHNGYGHGLTADPSDCVKKHVRDYFVDGTLPDENAEVCEPNEGPWEMYAKQVAAAGGSEEAVKRDLKRRYAI